MNRRMVVYLLGLIVAITGLLLLIPLLVSFLYDEPLTPFLWPIAISAGVSLPCILQKPRKNTRIFAKEGFVCVTGAWIVMSAIGALPFVFSGAIPNYVDALFETVSGFTTTGATILTEIASLPRGILFWRSFTHWVGGMGVLLFMIALLPSADGQMIHLMRAETPGPTKGKLVPQMKKSALILYAIYSGLTVVMLLALLCTGMPFYDSLVNALATAGTGGFSVLNDSIAGYHNPAAEWIIAVFMFLFGVNFNLYFFLLTKRWRDVVASEELRAFLILTVLTTAVISVNTWATYASGFDCIRTAFFQVTSVASTTGFTTVNFDLWPSLSKAVLVLLMFTGACAGSTAGGLKMSRVLILCKSSIRQCKQILRPHSVNVVRLDGEVVPEETVKSATNYTVLYFILIIFSTLAVSLNGFDFETNLTAVLTCINNVGPGLGAVVGPAGNFSSLSVFSKIVLTVDMLLGRLEIVPLVIFCAPSTWKGR